ncbi:MULTISPECIES: right-handed parallel beta-helix repeat-containing protein [unclassified Flavobacterium]|uniref:right-handed parallel beta-helix repeat-containing protein n=1 Tax=unclassified Flavobacterium TaxID=196869 RepID=UPI003F911031
MKILYMLLMLSLFSCSKEEAAVDTVVYVKTITLSGSNITTGNTGQITAETLPSNATNKTVSWKSSDTTIAEISSSGLLTAKKNGKIIITATAADKNTVTATKEITISSFSNGQTFDYTVSNSAELLVALAKVKAGETIALNGGTYTMSSKIVLSVSGTANNKISLIGLTNSSRPILDFSAMAENGSNQGIVLSANYWYIKGIDIYKAGDNGLQIKGNNNVIEFCTFSECKDTGLQIDNGASNNTILNCDSYFNADAALENADGFACKLNAGTGNKFVGCRAWQNLDDGWDGYLRGTDNITTTYQNCWAVKNGYLKTGVKGAGDGNGFKTGGSDDKLLKHNATYTNCVAVGNVADGFDHNSNRGVVTIYNCSAYSNGVNYSFSNTNPLAQLIIINSNVLGSFGSTNATLLDVTNNSWQNGLVVTAADFKSLDFQQLLAARKADGSLPDINFFYLNADSKMIDKGVDVGLAFKGSAPDLGAFEY